MDLPLAQSELGTRTAFHKPTASAAGTHTLSPEAAEQEIERQAEVARVKTRRRAARHLGQADREGTAAEAEIKRRAAETAQLEAERKAAEEKAIAQWVEVLWQHSPGGQAEQPVRQRCEHDHVRFRIAKRTCARPKPIFLPGRSRVVARCAPKQAFKLLRYLSKSRL